MIFDWRVGDWASARQGNGSFAAGCAVYRVTRVDPKATLINFNGGEWNAEDFERVTVRPAKARRTLTLSHGLAWLEAYRATGPLFLRPPLASGNGWDVFELSRRKVLGSGATPLKAIIAARKALRTKERGE